MQLYSAKVCAVQQASTGAYPPLPDVSPAARRAAEEAAGAAVAAALPAIAPPATVGDDSPQFITSPPADHQHGDGLLING